jgi:hypothetical protein
MWFLSLVDYLHTGTVILRFPAMEQAQSSARLLLHAGDDDQGEEPGRLRNDAIPIVNGPTNDTGDFGDVSPLHANEDRDEPERSDRDNTLPALNRPLRHPLINGYDIEMNERPQNSYQRVSLPDHEVQAITRQDFGDTRTSLSQQGAQLKKHPPTTIARIGLGWNRFFQFIARMWAKGWTAEICSYIVTILALA